jgi:hypothetical protein
MSALSDYSENALLNTFRGGGAGTSYTAPANVYVKLHTGAPGEAGTGNAATETTRVEVTFAAASAGSMASSNTPEWTNVAASETYSHISLWDNSTAGNCLWAGGLSAGQAVTAGDTFRLTSLTLTLA